MTDGVPRFSSWFQRWWTALIGAVVAVGGAVIYEAADWSLPRGAVTYSSARSASWGFVASGREFLYLQRFGETLVLVGLVAVAATVVVRLVRRRGTGVTR